MNVSRGLDILNHTLGIEGCDSCEVKDNCKILETVYDLTFCDAIEIIENPKKFIDKEI